MGDLCRFAIFKLNWNLEMLVHSITILDGVPVVGREQTQNLGETPRT